MDEELAQLKKVFRALAVSSPAQVDVRSLFKDYRSMLGHPVPIHKWGYKDPLLFLREQCTDCFMISGPTLNPHLTLIVTDSIKHIDKFVQKQKVTGAVKFKGKRRSVPESLVKPKSSLVADTYNVARESSPAVNVAKRSDRSKDTIENKENESRDTLDSKPNEVKTSGENATTCPVEVLRGFYKRRQKCHNVSQTGISTCIPQTCNTESKKFEKEGKDQTKLNDSSSKLTKVDQLKKEIMGVISAHPQGVWCADLVRLYREKHNRELSFSMFGFSSLLSLVCTMDVKVERPRDADDWLLLDPRVAPQVTPGPASYHPRERPPKPDPVDPDDALPGIDYDPDVFPEDCMHFTESIPCVSVAGLSPGAILEVMVAEVYSPSHFWLIRLGDLFNIAMEDTMDEMTRYYRNGEGKERRLARGAVRVGQYCASLYDNDFHRSLIVKIIDSETVKVRHVDYGTVDLQSVYALRPLLRKWGTLSAQAVRARLAGVRPSGGGRRWPHAASTYFLHKIRNKQLVANVLAVDPEENVIEVSLIDTTTDDDVCIATEMIKAGHADPRPDSSLRTSECHLYPRFEVIETGETPNFGEIYKYLIDGIALEYVEEYRRHVPACLPADSPPPLLDNVPPSSPPPLSSTPTPLPLSVVNRIPILSPPSLDASVADAPATSKSSPGAGSVCAPLSNLDTASCSSSENSCTNFKGSFDQEAPRSLLARSNKDATKPVWPIGPMNFRRDSALATYSELDKYPELSEEVRPPHLYMPVAAGPRHEQRPTWPPGFAPVPPRPYMHMPTPSPPVRQAVNLSVSDIEIYKVLSMSNPQLAHKFMADALERAMAELHLHAATATATPYDPMSSELPPSIPQPPNSTNSSSIYSSCFHK